MDIDAYLQRMGASAPAAASLAALADLHEQHLLAVPFENLDIHRGVPIALDEERILDKIVRQRRGGFCYELNTAFAWLLRGLGYQVSMLSAEVAGEDGSFGIPFDHMLLRVDLGPAEPAHIADVGFGDCFRRPLPLVPDAIAGEAHARYRLIQRGDAWLLERAEAGSGDFAAQHRFTTTPRCLAEYADACAYHQTSPESPFTRKHVVTRATPEGRITLRADRLIVTAGGERTETPVAHDAAWQQALRAHFGMELDAPAGLRT